MGRVPMMGSVFRVMRALRRFRAAISGPVIFRRSGKRDELGRAASSLVRIRAMAAVVEIPDPRALRDEARAEIQRALDGGAILSFPCFPIAIAAQDREFLLSLRQTRAAYHKNIAYRPAQERVSGFTAGNPGGGVRLRDVLRRYSKSTIAFLGGLFPRYAAAWTVDYASFRRLEEAGRDLSASKRNDRLHVDASPTRPTRGDRILRFFTNVNPENPRHWKTGSEVFPALAERFARASGLLAKAERGGLVSRARRWGAALGLPVAAHSAYDRFVLLFHDFLKSDDGYQRSAPADEFRFPPGSSWMVYTDTVSHAVLSGRFAIEQTVRIARRSLAVPDRAPIAVLEKLAGRALA